MKSKNKTISSCFDLIDTDDSGTISKDELVKALAKFNLGIPEREIKMLVNPLTRDPNEQSITKEMFIKKFWSAYTFGEVFSSRNL